MWPDWAPWLILAATNTIYGLTLRTLVKLYREATGLLRQLLLDSERRAAAERTLTEQLLAERRDAPWNSSGSGRHGADRWRGGATSGESSR